jgi:hypothetical protein
MIRLNLYLSETIFSDRCSLWKGHIGSSKTHNQINFQLNKNRRSVQRIIYINYIDSDIKQSDIIIAKCNNTYTCCTICHLHKK